MNKLIVDGLFKFYDEKNILFNRNDVFESNKITCIKGFSGSGKSTYLSILAGILNYEKGNIIFNNKNINEFYFDFYSLNIRGYVFQKPILSSYLNVNDLFKAQWLMYNYKNNDYNYDKVLKIIQKLEIDLLLNKFAYELSGGQKYRVALGLASIGNKSILICDEPTAHLDFDSSKKIINFIKEYILENKSIGILSSHDEYVLENSDIILKI
jgi:ABC-type lipoprotein export system ATPase subunit